ncbi:MDR family MFS transporter [Nocardioides sp. GY 10127]|uniref:MDR family MFS transporter n=1 Tax=Nocardioides sp. GY 10127 TaxID=2569762 RepID=UPI0010A8F5CF|nr:MDR family MFS transporter [Nocardioides sp. GY 10127]TIC79013.1 MFS transporter [Nocardioides sp. GY 10127]
MTHREVLTAMSGLLLAMFVAMLSSTVVTNALPTIVADLDGSQTGYTWVVVATLLTTTVSTPLWGKTADLVSKKLLVQLGLSIYVLASLLASFAPSMSVLIAARALQGVGAGGILALVQVVIGTIVSPRERGRYSGYLGAVFAVATVSGPLVGGLVVDSVLGWRGVFWLSLPFAVAALVVLQRTLHLPTAPRREVHVDVLGSLLLVGGVSLLLIWVSLAGDQFDWVSGTTALMVGGAVVVLALAVLVEAKVARDPVLPLDLFRDRVIVLAVIASAMVGVAMFGATVYLSQYFQTARGMTPTEAGLMSICMVGGLLVSSITSGRVITATGLWKRWLVGGMVLVVVGLGLLATIDETTSLVVIGLFMAVLGVGLGATMQNLVLVVQNAVPLHRIGVASSVAAFFRTLGGSIGVSALGALLAHRVTSDIVSGLAALGIDASDVSGTASTHSLPAPVLAVVEHAYGDGFSLLFLVAAPLAAVALVAVLLMREVPLRTTVGAGSASSPAGARTAEAVPAVPAAPAAPTGSGAGDLRHSATRATEAATLEV